MPFTSLNGAGKTKLVKHTDEEQAPATSQKEARGILAFLPNHPAGIITLPVPPSSPPCHSPQKRFKFITFLHPWHGHGARRGRGAKTLGGREAQKSASAPGNRRGRGGGGGRRERGINFDLLLEEEPDCCPPPPANLFPEGILTTSLSFLNANEKNIKLLCCSFLRGFSGILLGRESAR